MKPFVKEAVKELRRRNIKIGSTTGYTDAMMEIVVPRAAENGYAPDFWISPNSVGNMGRPYPYMIFENMRQLKLSDVRRVIKVGDTVSDVKEGVCAGVISVGVLEGSSELGYSEEEYNALTEAEKKTAKEKASEKFKEAGADYVIDHMGQLASLIDRLEN